MPTKKQKNAQQLEKQTESATFPPDKFPPDGLYTAKWIADYLGIHEDTVRKRYYERYCLEIYANCPETLRRGLMYTQIFFDECLKIRQSCDSDRLVFNSKGQVVRHVPEVGKFGLPITEPNLERMSKAAYIKGRFEESPELKPEIREDSLEAAVFEGEIIEPKNLAKYDPSATSQITEALDRSEDIGSTLRNFLAQIEENAERDADIIVGAYAQKLTTKIQKKMGGFTQDLGKNLKL